MQKQHQSVVCVGKAIRQRRKELGFSQEDFANQIGLDRSYYGHIERGNYNLTITALLRIAVGLDVPAGELLAEAQKEVLLDPELKQLT